MTTIVDAAIAPDAAHTLTPDALPLGEPLEWPLVDHDGVLLMERGAIIVGTEERQFLFEHFSPRRGDLDDATADVQPESAVPHQASVGQAREMHLAIGALMGLRTQTSSSSPMQPCRLIGLAPNDALFVTPPQAEGRVLPLMVGENVEIVAIASQSVFRFVCSVEAICQLPFDYLVLSQPAAIRRLRERNSIRVRARFPVRYGLAAEGSGYDGVALAKGLSALGMSLAAAWTLGAVGERLRVAFRLRSADLDTTIETSAVIRNLHKEGGESNLVTHGLEFDQLTPAEQMAMKVYVFDRQDDVVYWTGVSR